MSSRSFARQTALVLSCFAFLAVQPCVATVYQQTEKVLTITSIDHVVFGDNRDSVRIVGFSAAGTCGTDNGLVAIVFRGSGDEGKKAQLSILLSAMMSDRSVTITVDDAQKNSLGFCYLRTVTIN
jgi:hypothetical protein